MSEQYPYTNLPSLDEDVVRPLKELLGDSFPELIDDFLTSFPHKLKDLKAASRCDNVDAILQISHTLKSSSGSFGFVRLFKRLEHLELQARKDTIENQSDQVELIDQEFKYILSQLDNG